MRLPDDESQNPSLSDLPVKSPPPPSFFSDMLATAASSPAVGSAFFTHEFGSGSLTVAEPIPFHLFGVGPRSLAVKKSEKNHPEKYYELPNTETLAP